MTIIRTTSIVFAVVMMFAATDVLAQSNWDLYEPRTLKEFTEEIGPKAIEKPDVLIKNDQNKVSTIISYNSFQSRVKLIYSGESRKVSDSRKEVISIWLKTFGKPPEYLELFENEYLFKENNVEYWLPVQRQVASYFPDELKKGDAVTLLVAWLGVRKQEEALDQIFLVNEFEVEEADR